MCKEEHLFQLQYKAMSRYSSFEFPRAGFVCAVIANAVFGFFAGGILSQATGSLVLIIILALFGLVAGILISIFRKDKFFTVVPAIEGAFVLRGKYAWIPGLSFTVLVIIGHVYVQEWLPVLMSQ